MKARPLHRSLTFWLGLPGLLFILWTWHDSLNHEMGIFRPVWIDAADKSAGHDDMLSYGYAGFWATYCIIGPGTSRTVFREPVQITRREIKREIKDFRAVPIFEWDTPDAYFNDPGIRNRTLVIPHWLALIIYGVGWSGVTFWRCRWIRNTEQLARR